MPQQRRFILTCGTDAWYCESVSEPNRSECIELFGTAKLATNFTPQAPASEVKAFIEGKFPGSLVEVANEKRFKLGGKWVTGQVSQLVLNATPSGHAPSSADETYYLARNGQTFVRRGDEVLNPEVEYQKPIRPRKVLS